jgi:Tfp pilus assembly protein PilF
MSWREWLGLASAPAKSTVDAGSTAPSQAAQDLFEAGLKQVRAGQQAEAGNFFEQAVEAAPEFAAAHRELARARIALGNDPAAADSLELAAHYRPDDAGTCFLQGLLAQRGGQVDAAIAHYQRALALEPDFSDAHNNLGYLLLNERDEIEQASAHFNTALKQRPDFIDAMLNLGQADLYAGRRAQAIARFDAVLARKPASADRALARLNRGLARLALRQWQGWDDYEARKHAWPSRPYRYPEWNGKPAPGKTLLLYAEQGLGDEIMFASCIPEALQRMHVAGGRCVIECSPRLAALFARSFAGAEVHGVQQGAAPDWLGMAGTINLQLAVGSLPGLFRRNAAAFPRRAEYLQADPHKVAVWKARLGALGARPKIALSWRGGTQASRQGRRSIDPALLARSLRHVAAEFISLQYGAVEQDLAAFRAAGLVVHHWPEAIADYDETAALLCAADLTLSVCTALIHLGGALGRPLWVLAPAHPEWRYGDAGEDMPWYPSLRVLRQSVAGEWQAVLEMAGAELERRFRPAMT